MEKNKYFIGCRLNEAGATRCQEIATYLFETYGIKNVFQGYPPHMTWKAPFMANEIEQGELYELLEKFVNGRKIIHGELNGFGHFGSGIVYVDIICNHDDIVQVQAELCAGLESLPWMPFERNEPSGIPHVTVGRDDIRARFPQIYDDLKREFIESVPVTISGVEVFEKIQGVWEVVKTFPLAQ